MNVSIIIVNYNTKDITQKCISSIFEQTKDIAFEVILVDNHSTDGSVEAFEAEKRIVFIPLAYNMGFGKANNAGLERSSGEYVFFLNSDTCLLNNAVKEFYDFAEKHKTEKIGCIGCRLKKADMSYCHSYARFPSVLGELWKPIILPLSRVLGTTYQYLDKPQNSEDEFQVDYVTGADLFAKRSVIEACGAFDPDFFMYYEESEMQYRWTKAGYKSMMISSPQILHLEGASYKTDKKRNVRKELQVIESLFLYVRKTHSFLAYLFFRICYFLVKLPFLLFSCISMKDRMQYLKLIALP